MSLLFFGPSLDTFLLTSLAISLPWIYITTRRPTTNLPIPYRRALSIFLLVHTLYNLFALTVACPPNIFTRLGIPLSTPIDKIREALTRGLDLTKPLPEPLELLLKRLGSFDLRILYVRFGNTVLQTCEYCMSYDEYALFALTEPLLSYTRECAVVGLITIQGTRRERLRVLGIGALILAGLTEGYWITTADIRIPRDNSGVVMWHDIFYVARHILFIILPLLLHIFPPSPPPPLSQKTLDTTIQIMNATLNRVYLLRYVRGAVMRTPELRDKTVEWWKEQAQEGEWIRTDDAVRKVSEKEGLGFAEQREEGEDGGVRPPGRLRTTAHAMTNELLGGFAVSEHWR